MFSRSAFDPRLILDIAREARRNRASALHVHGYAAANFGRIAARFLGIPLILHEHFADPKMPGYQKPPDFVLRTLTTRGIAVSRSTARFMIGERFVPEERVEVVYNGAPLDEFALAAQAGGENARRRVREEFGVPLEAPLVATIGRLNAQKGHEVLIEAAVRALKTAPTARFLIVGDGDRLEALKAQVLGLGIEPAVHFAGHRTDVPQILAASDALCISSHYEGTPLVLFEAMAAGKCVVSTAVDGCAEVIAEGLTGFLTPPGDGTLLGEALARVLADPDLLRRTGRAALQASSRYDVRAAVNRIQDIYDEVLTRRPSPKI
jgi:glycosyltransferase involved in cell wall biosynthesis